LTFFTLDKLGKIRKNLEDLEKIYHQIDDYNQKDKQEKLKEEEFYH